MGKLFISYRRDDTQEITGHIYDRLKARFGKENIFMDVDSMPLGLDYRQVLSDAVASSSVVMVMIGRQWLTVVDKQGQRRLDNPNDPVRIEVEAALARNIPVVPVLAQGAAMPKESDLPKSIAALAFRNGTDIRSGEHFTPLVEQLIGRLVPLLLSTPDSLPSQPPASEPSIKTGSVETGRVAGAGSRDSQRRPPTSREQYEALSDQHSRLSDINSPTGHSSDKVNDDNSSNGDYDDHDDRAKSADNEVELLTRDLRRRDEFDRRMRVAMCRYSELVAQTRNETRPERLNGLVLPQDTMQFLERIIRDVIFDGFQVRVQLLLKSVETSQTLPKLVPTYLAPDIAEGPESLLYPASVAAWALVLGCPLMFPEILQGGSTENDHEWLRRSNKIGSLLQSLELLRQDAQASSDRVSSNRFEALHSKLKDIAENRHGSIAGETIYQTAPPASSPSSYPYFVCIPYPMRPQRGALLQLPEIAVLDVSVRPMAQPARQHQPQPKEEAPFTPERLAMLEYITALIGLTLTTSSALGKPPGIWESHP